MCYYQRIITNPKYKKTKKNGGIIPPVKDERMMGIPIGCGECRECRKQKKRDWTIRLSEEIKSTTLKGHMVTLTFSTDSLKHLNNEYIKKKAQSITGEEIKIKIPIASLEGYEKDNAIATRAMELFRERWRKEFKTAPRRFTITELGNGKWEHMHIHGIIWTNEDKRKIQEHWQYGHVWSGQQGKDTYVNERTISYIVKYITKIDPNHKYYKPIILCSPGIGANYTQSQKSKDNTYNGDNTTETYKTTTGHKIALPIYYRNKIYTEEEREELWIQKLNKQIRYVNGIKFDISKSDVEYKQALQYAQYTNERDGFGNGEHDWSEKKLEEQRRKYKLDKRIK